MDSKQRARRKYKLRKKHEKVEEDPYFSDGFSDPLLFEGDDEVSLNRAVTDEERNPIISQFTHEWQARRAKGEKKPKKRGDKHGQSER